MQKLTIAFFTCICLLSAGLAHAANFFVRPNGGSYGSENGSDWNNAFDGFSGINWGSINAGDTIWVAGGNYTQALVPAKSGTSASPISVRRARSDASQCTGAAGWSSAFNATVHQVQQSITFNSFNFVTVSGRTTAAGGTVRMVDRLSRRFSRAWNRVAERLNRQQHPCRVHRCSGARQRHLLCERARY